MTGSVSKGALEPAEEAKVEITVDTRKFAGSRNMTVYVMGERRGCSEVVRFTIKVNSQAGPAQ
jgi:hypothetical protein